MTMNVSQLRVLAIACLLQISAGGCSLERSPEQTTEPPPKATKSTVSALSSRLLADEGVMIVSLLPSAGSVTCPFNLEGRTLHCTPVSSIPQSIGNMRHRNEIVMAASIVSDITGDRCPTKACLTLNGLATNLDSQGAERPAISYGAWLSKRLMLRGEVGAYQFFEINPRLDQIRVICYIVAPALKREMTEACRSVVLESS